MTRVQPRTLEWIGEAPVLIDRTATIAASPTELWELMADNPSWPSWFPGFKTCKFVSEAPHGVGSIRKLHQDQFKVTEEILRWEPGSSWAMTVVEINFGILAGMAEEVTLSEEELGYTSINWRIGIEISTWAKPLRRPVVAKTTKALEQALVNLDRTVTEKSG